MRRRGRTGRRPHACSAVCSALGSWLTITRRSSSAEADVRVIEAGLRVERLSCRALSPWASAISAICACGLSAPVRGGPAPPPARTPRSPHPAGLLERLSELHLHREALRVVGGDRSLSTPAAVQSVRRGDAPRSAPSALRGTRRSLLQRVDLHAEHLAERRLGLDAAAIRCDQRPQLRLAVIVDVLDHQRRLE